MKLFLKCEAGRDCVLAREVQRGGHGERYGEVGQGRKK